MDKIVTEPMKIDFHIHSVYSKYKDEYNLVKEGTIDNIGELLQKLDDNNINMCAITDHDFFSYDLYSQLKLHENKNGKLKKVFPGVEFSVGLKNVDNKIKPIHVICIFDDEDDEKVKRIEDLIPFKDNKVQYDRQEEQFFSEEKFISVLRDIDLNMIAIAHQKQSVCSKTASKSKNDVSSLGAVKFNELVQCEYFESFEFKNMKNGLFNNIYAIQKNKNYDQIRFITGSDCHDWRVYPKHDKDENSNIGFNFTYLKCLPCFRGLAMAFSDMRRISTKDYIFTPRSKQVDEIKISINQKDYTIPLSPGINVIIGDNSVGKSLLLHTLTNYEYLNNKNIERGYKDYLKNHNIDIKTKISKNQIHTFDYQGCIRDRFSNDRQDNSEFLANKFPEDLNKDIYITKILTIFNPLFECLENKFNYDEKYKELNLLTMVDTDVSNKNLAVRKIKSNQNKIKEFKKMKNYYNSIITKIDDGYKNITDYEEKKTIDEFRVILESYMTKYVNLLNIETKEYSIKSNINNAISIFNNELKNWKTDNETKKIKFDVDDSDNLSNTIVDLIKLERNIKSFSFNVSPENIVPEVLKFGPYSFIKKFKNCSIINNEYLEDVLARVLKSRVQLDTSKITKDELKISINNFGEDDSSVINVFKEKIHKILEDDLKSVPAIIKGTKDIYAKLSNGMNSTIYFDILSADQKEGIYVVDQPEDDISQNSIKSNVLNNFKTMSNQRQILMITHNPQFVVNLDVDNVICITKDNHNEITIKSGALEYVDKNENIDILETVACSLDGGIESIRKRWKRYEKTISFDEN